MSSTRDSKALPGDKLAVVEEFLLGKNVYEQSGSVRALLVGKVKVDQSKGEISVYPVKIARTPALGDLVTGQVEAVQTSSAGIRIYYINGKPTDQGFSGMLLMRGEPGGRGARRRTYVKLGDIVRASVSSTLNGIIQLSIDNERTGVVFAKCSNCGRPLTRGGSYRAKCDECGNVEERKFANDFGQFPIQP
ncbi:MAG: exosome complex RNA-binding protein Csl4 [Thaumarchaeota archaeon]|nr:exosome complex RNA-binding protein Csl4 [Nitrososphaerota archaeon]